MRTLLAFVVIPFAAVAGEPTRLTVDNWTGSSTAVIVENVPLIHTGQFTGPGRGTVSDQVEAAIRNVRSAVAAAGGDPGEIVKLNVGVATADVVGPVREAIARSFPREKRPAVGYVVGKLPVPDAVVAIDAVAPAGGKAKEPQKKGPGPVAGAPAATLPAGRRVFVSGQAEKAATPAEAARKTLASLRATLQWLGLNDSHVVQCKAFLTPMSAAREVIAEFQAHFGKNVPPLILVEWESTLPIEIELIASVPGSATQTDPVEFLTPPGMTASPIYSRVTRVASDRFIYTGGLVAPKAGTGAQQVAGTFDRLRDLLKEAGSDFGHLAKATYYVADEEASAALNKLRPRYYDPKRPPAASKAKVPGVGIPERTLVLDMIAVPIRK